MTTSRFFVFLGVLFVVAVLIYVFTVPHVSEIPLTGVVDGNEVIVSAKIMGRIERLLVDEGSEVKEGQVIAELDTAELAAERDSAAAAILSFQAQVVQIQRTRGLTDQQTAAQLDQAGATVTAMKAQLEAARADLTKNTLDQKRAEGLFAGGVATAQDKDHADAALRSSQASVKSLEDQVKAQEAALAVARANRKQLDVQQSAIASMQAQLAQARAAKAEAETRLGYTKITAPLSGIVSVRVARQGEVVQPGAPIVTIVDIDHLRVRASVEESYVDMVQFGQKLKVQLPSGDVIEGSVIFKGVENEFATQRDVSRTKRDIKTFAIKVAIPNPGRRLFAGMTAIVLLPSPAKNKSWFSSSR